MNNSATFLRAPAFPGALTLRRALMLLLALSFALLLSTASAETIWLDQLDISKAEQGYGKTQRNTSLDGNPLSIAGVAYERGIGTHASAVFRVNLPAGVQRFTALAGVDDEIGPNAPATVEFRVYGDEKVLWKSGVMRYGDKAKKININIERIRKYHGPLRVLNLLIGDAGDDIHYDHADWVDAKIEYTGPEAPSAIGPVRREPYILTPIPPRKPRINGPRVLGARPGSPFLYTIPATGERPMEFSARGLPPGVALDAKTGRLTGAATRRGEYKVTLMVENPLGRAERELRVTIGEQIALTPPLGWNSWNCWAGAVDDAKVRSSAKAMAQSGLLEHGWSYINIDDTWQAARGGEFHAIQGNEKFPDMTALCDYVHSLGLKIGIYSTPWITSYANHIGGSSDDETGLWSDEKHNSRLGWRHGKNSFAGADAKQWAAWGMDYLKYDWNPNDVPHVSEMAGALRVSGRDIVYSLSNSAPFDGAADWARLAQAWRTTGDIEDTWASMSGIGFSQDQWAPHAGPGHWNDADMLVVGKVGWGPSIHPTRLSPDEQYTHISLWCLLASPLLLGNDLADMDTFTLSLLTNDEALDVNQDPLGRQATRVSRVEDGEVWAKDMEDGSKAVGLFNRGPLDIDVVADWKDLGVKGPRTARDLWRQKDLGVFEDKFSTRVPSHGVVLLRLIPREEPL